MQYKVQLYAYREKYVCLKYAADVLVARDIQHIVFFPKISVENLF